jgi:uncharacterized protein YggE
LADYTRPMWKVGLVIFSLAAAPVFAQLPSNTLTITANRTINPQPDEALFSLSVTSSATTNLGQIVAALSGVGITSENLAGVGNNTTPPSFQWNFTLDVPLSNLTATIASLNNLEKTIAQNNSGLILTFTVEGTQVSPAAQQQQQSQPCSNAELIADATAQAQKLAAAAGMILGPIMKLSNAPTAGQIYAVPNSVILTGVLGAFSFVVSAPAPSSATCSLVVQFQLQS